jgi:hypothetical protein
VLQTDNLFLGAFGLLRGGELRDVLVRGTNGRRVAVFLIDGPEVADVERDYYRGPSLVDLRLFKSEVSRLKSIAFEALRKEESRHAATDHTGGHPAYQGAELPRRGRR